MIGYVTLGSNKLQEAFAFYDQLLAQLGAKRTMEFKDEEGNDKGVVWGTSMTQPSLAVVRPYNKEMATYGNGTMVALAVDSKEKVDTLYSKALALGGSDEGAPGFRSENFYGAYFRDLDGNKLALFHIVM